jgi:sarcosine oxidase
VKSRYDVIVIGCGGLGSAALYWLSRRLGGEVLGIEQFRHGHANGASQDHSRIIRLSYDSPAYTALTPFTYIAYREVEAEANIQLVHQTGGVIFGPYDADPANSPVGAYIRAMRQAGFPHQEYTPAELRRRFPQFHLQDGDRAVYQASDGFVDPGKATAVHASLARQRGAALLDETRVEAVNILPDSVEVRTSGGTFHARRLVVASGAWTNQVLAGAGLQIPLTVTEEQVTYFASPDLRSFMPDRFPIWIYVGAECYYGFPVYGEVAVKAGQDLGGDPVTPATRTFQPNPRPLAKLKAFLGNTIPGVLGPELYTKPCLYTMPPDRNFILDTLPGAPHVSLAVGAGHAFKFASLFGLILSQLAIDSETVYPISAFSLTRPALTDPHFPWVVPHPAQVSP